MPEWSWDRLQKRVTEAHTRRSMHKPCLEPETLWSGLSISWAFMALINLASSSLLW